MSACFEIDQRANGQFHFVLKAANGQVILNSEMYGAKSSAQAGIASVQANCAVEANYEKLTAKDQRCYFNLRAKNHQVIGTSQMYTTAAARDNGIESVKTNGTTQVIIEKTQA